MRKLLLAFISTIFIFSFIGCNNQYVKTVDESIEKPTSFINEESIQASSSSTQDFTRDTTDSELIEQQSKAINNDGTEIVLKSSINDGIEVQVHKLFKGNKTTLKDIGKIINLIPDINWSKYAENNSDEFFRLMECMGKLEINDKSMMTKILNATNGLDGAYTDAYCSAVKNLFFNNKDMFVKALVDIDDEQIELISSYIHYGCNPDEANNIKNYFRNVSEPKAILFLKNFNIEVISEPKIVDNLKSIEIENLNDDKNTKVKLELPDGWIAKEYISEIAPGFEFKSEKNKSIKKNTWFDFYNTKKKETSNQYGIKGLSGGLEMLGYYRDQPLRSIFPNHSSMTSKVFSGMTILGKGDIYILNCDLSKELITNKYSTYDMIYVWIPINNEDLANNLTITVPLGEKPDLYVDMAKKVLKAQ